MPVITELEIVTVAWEPCSEFHDDPDAADGCCAGCGWAPDDHEAVLPVAA
jgi:hypothetical protein